MLHKCSVVCGIWIDLVLIILIYFRLIVVEVFLFIKTHLILFLEPISTEGEVSYSKETTGTLTILALWPDRQFINDLQVQCAYNCAMSP